MTDETVRPEITGKDLIDWGHRPGPGFAALLEKANAARAEGYGLVRIRDMLAEDMAPPPPPKLALREPGAVPFHANIEAEGPDEEKNLAAVNATMTELMRTPTLQAGAIMPDACPAGPMGTIPVGGVAAAENAIHPGMHSADICCSVMLTDLGPANPKAVLDAAAAATHFGPGGRQEGGFVPIAATLLERFRENPFLNEVKALRMAESHMATQGDGNHFLFVGRSRATGRTAMITHHGSRGPGARLYRAGMAVAERYRRELSPETQRQNAWIPADTEDGRAYWAALQIIRDWTKANHTAIHDATASALGLEAADRFWNEHNFVFERGGIYYHGKGATPAWAGFAADARRETLIPLNMAEPVLVVRGRDAPHALGFSPHGAGRNFSRSEHRRRMGKRTADQLLAAETEGLDVRFYAGRVDISELPSSYKRAEAVTQQIRRYDLAEVTDYIDPYGCIMAGDFPQPWRQKRGVEAATDSSDGS